MKSTSAVGAAPGIELFEMMVRIRVFEEQARVAYDAGDCPGVVHLSIGQEATAAGVCANLRRDDYVASTHRGHGHCLAKGADPSAMMRELCGREGGICKGKGGSMHIADFSIGMLGANGVVGGGIGIACGAAQASRILGRDAVTVCFFGDGAVNRGPFLEGLNWAVIFGLPVVFICEDNEFAAFTQTGTLTAGEGPLARAAAIGIPAQSVDGNDVLAVHALAGELIARARSGGGPAFIHARTYRLDGHTVFDKAPYRDPADVERARERDPIERLRGSLIAGGTEPTELAAIQTAAQAEMVAALTDARSAPFPDVAETYTDVQDVGAPVRVGGPPA